VTAALPGVASAADGDTHSSWAKLIQQLDQLKYMRMRMVIPLC